MYDIQSARTYARQRLSSGHPTLGRVLLPSPAAPSGGRLRAAVWCLGGERRYDHEGLGRHLLLVVEETLLLAARKRLMVAPFLDASTLPPSEFAVELLKPDGSSTNAQAIAIVPFSAGPIREARAHLALMGVGKEDVPVGTAVWTVE